jgi:hypothetical protein
LRWYFTGLFPIYHCIILRETFILAYDGECIILNFTDTYNSQSKIKLEGLMSVCKLNPEKPMLHCTASHISWVLIGIDIHFSS